MTPFAPPESCTDMRECRHWKKNCHKCLIPELVDGLEWDSAAFIEVLQKAEPAGEGWYKVPPGVLAMLGELETCARALIEKAKLVEECES